MLYGMTYIVRPREQLVELGAHFRRRHPVVVRSRVFLVAAAHESAFFHARDIVRIGARKKTAGALLGIELDQHPRCHHFLAQAVVLFLRTVTPVDAVRLGQLRDIRDPLPKPGVVHIGWRCGDLRDVSRKCGLVHWMSFPNDA
jgi:hypothetical protein